MTTKAFAEADRHPTAGLVTGAGKGLGIGEGFGDQATVAEAFVPMRRRGAGGGGEGVGSEIGVGAARVQQQIAAILGDELEAFELMGQMPADPLVAVFGLEGGRSPEPDGDPLAVAGDDLAELIAHRVRMAEVMMLLGQEFEAWLVLGGEKVDLKIGRCRLAGACRCGVWF